LSYLLKAVGGAALFCGSVALFNVELVALLEAGTCASGNVPYEVARPCPEGAGTDFLLLSGSVLTALAGVVVFALRGRPPWAAGTAEAPRAAAGVIAWGIFFTATGAVSLYHSLSSATIGPDGKTGGIIVGATFLLMGVPALALLVAAGRERLRGDRAEPSPAAGSPDTAASPTAAYSSPPPGERSASATAVPGPVEGSGRLTQLERLQRLRKAGALSEAEFELEKRRILEG
jgi:hypothetical protein